jgi:hypothetical protein
MEARATSVARASTEFDVGPDAGRVLRACAGEHAGVPCSPMTIEADWVRFAR